MLGTDSCQTKILCTGFIKRIVSLRLLALFPQLVALIHISFQVFCCCCCCCCCCFVRKFASHEVASSTEHFIIFLLISSAETPDTMWGINFSGLWCLGNHPPAHGRLPPDALVLQMCGSFFSSAVHIRDKVRL